MGGEKSNGGHALSCGGVVLIERFSAS